ncbi:peptidoglycan D,D-transpeptidase FtsI family protein [Chengkuizengella sediminis]|uniref:peptidoglycan D,D-transpeptidase FtsI family protein n=1 Tax=Chengkuizengella sediminis TaxID=1885917 RepID=UPI00138A09FA|nr:penicillin-binding protein 2 [Chengkuizengella sediminis]NDI33855.1 penicillin-binding protein 2 [Chengkuizengella sediminis]
MDKRRILITLLCFTLIIGLLGSRLFWIQVVETRSYSNMDINLIERSVNQRESGVILSSGRGHFYDRNGDSLTGRLVHVLAVFPNQSHFLGNEQKIKKLVSILDISEEEWIEFFNSINEPVIWKVDSTAAIPYLLTSDEVADINELHLPGIQAIQYELRYPDPYIASHLIGFVGENPSRIKMLYPTKIDSGAMSLSTLIGASGLEKTLDFLIQSVEDTSLSFFTDGKHRAIPGLDLRLIQSTNPFYPLKIKTTIDKNIQQNVEMIQATYTNHNSAVVILDTHNADVLAMASLPGYDPYRVTMTVNDWSNQALKAHIPGSIFKIIVAAAALENDLVDLKEEFECNGHLGKYGFTCWRKEGHGTISFEEAFAQSCNITFAKVMERMSSDMLEQTFKKLGGSQKNGWFQSQGDSVFYQFDHEEVGQIFSANTDRDDEGVKAQTSIGQRDVMMTPLQAVNLVVTLINQGEVKQPRVVKEIRYQNDSFKQAFDDKTLSTGENSISLRTSNHLLHWMEEVVQDGTGKSLKSHPWELAGKSGTAEVIVDGKKGENQWFIGYGPSKDPRYAIAVFVQNPYEGGQHIATKIFGEIMGWLAENGY